RVRMQLHPDRLTPVSGPATMRVGEDPTSVFHAKMDVNPLKAIGQKPIAPPNKPDGHELSEGDASANGETVAATTSFEGTEVSTEATPAAATPASPVASPAGMVAPWEKANAAPVPGAEVEELPLPKNWGESQGLVAVGVRMLQVAVEGE